VSLPASASATIHAATTNVHTTTRSRRRTIAIKNDLAYRRGGRGASAREVRDIFGT
jgi:hypothetical protein